MAEVPSGCALLLVVLAIYICGWPALVAWAVLTVVLFLLMYALHPVRWLTWVLLQCCCRLVSAPPQTAEDALGMLRWAMRNDVPAAIRGANSRARTAKMADSLVASRDDWHKVAALVRLPPASDYADRGNWLAVRRRVLHALLDHPLFEERAVVASGVLPHVMDIADPATWDRLVASGADVTELNRVRGTARTRVSEHGG
jgi:hypothetical protein